MPVFVTLCLSLLGCACLCSAMPVRVRLCLSLLGCACLCYAVPNRVQLCWPLRVPLLFRNRILTLIPLYKNLAENLVYGELVASWEKGFLVYKSEIILRRFAGKDCGILAGKRYTQSLNWRAVTTKPIF